MSNRYTRRDFVALAGAALASVALRRAPAERRLLYVASPGIRNYVEWGGVGVLVYDIDAGYTLVKRIPTFTYAPGETAENVKGICASAATGRLYVTTPKRVLCLDLVTETVRWTRAYDAGCDRLSITPDGTRLWLPSFEGAVWYVVDAGSGDVLQRVDLGSGAHNTIVGPSGAFAYLAGLRSPILPVADTRTGAVVRQVGPFSNVIRPFTIDGTESRCFVNVNDLLGFEVGDLRTGKMLHRVEVPGFSRGPVKRHGCPSHGIAMTRDESEIWVSDGANGRVHVFDATTSPPRWTTSIALRAQPGWITMTIDGRHAIPSTGEVVDVRTKRIVAALADETGKPVQSEKLLEIDVADGRPVRAGDEFAIGGRRA